MVEAKIREKNRGGTTWGWMVGAEIVVLLATAVTSRHSQKISHQKPCHCTEGSRKYTGMVEDCCCDYETVDSLKVPSFKSDRYQVRALEAASSKMRVRLADIYLSQTLRVKLWCDCPFWPDDGMCRLHDCSVCECPENEFPEPFKKPLHPSLSSDGLMRQEGKPQATVDRTLDSKAFRGWMEIDNPWTNDDETDDGEMT